ncbi:unnamed protein product [Jaminaea pallidilutea]
MSVLCISAVAFPFWHCEESTKHFSFPWNWPQPEWHNTTWHEVEQRHDHQCAGNHDGHHELAHPQLTDRDGSSSHHFEHAHTSSHDSLLSLGLAHQLAAAHVSDPYPTSTSDKASFSASGSSSNGDEEECATQRGRTSFKSNGMDGLRSPTKVLAYQNRLRQQRAALTAVITDLRSAYNEWNDHSARGEHGQHIRHLLRSSQDNLQHLTPLDGSDSGQPWVRRHRAHENEGDRRKARQQQQAAYKTRVKARDSEHFTMLRAVTSFVLEERSSSNDDDRQAAKDTYFEVLRRHRERWPTLLAVEKRLAPRSVIWQQKASLKDAFAVAAQCREEQVTRGEPYQSESTHLGKQLDGDGTTGQGQSQQDQELSWQGISWQEEIWALFSPTTAASEHAASEHDIN